MDEAALLAILEKIAPDVYKDVVQGTAHESGKFLERLARTLNSAFLSLDKWNMRRGRERTAYEFEQSIQLEHEKAEILRRLIAVPEEEIVEPPLYIVAPAMEAISYSMDASELKNMYANLLARSMMKYEQYHIHPGYIEIIKQMSPRDASNIKLFLDLNTYTLPIAEYRFGADYKYNVALSNVFLENKEFQDIDNQAVSISSLERLGLVTVLFTQTMNSGYYTKYTETEFYKQLEEGRVIFNTRMGELPVSTPMHIGKVICAPGIAGLTPFGEAFAQCCIADIKV